jgi:pimeloyl-ACP methyl ester carboxylesterase
LFAALLNGAMLCPFAMRSDGVARMAQWVRASRITVYHSVPTVFRRMARTVTADQGFEALRIIRLGGEPMLPADLELFRRHCPSQCRLMHVFSSTETGLVSARWIEHAAAAAETRLHVGRPVRDVTVMLLDEEGQPAVAGGEGRIAVAGVGIARGYWNQPELTKQAFRSCPDCPSSRIFVTGDLGRFDAQGNLEHLGRIDFQVKIRGQRVDLLLVETTLLALDEVEDAAVIARDEAGEALLVAYVVPRRSVTDVVQTCRRRLRETLPSAMLPDRILPLPELPLTPGGKVDRRGLQLRPIPRPASGRYRRTPRDGIEKRIASIWEGVLGVTGIGRDDDFFDMGGTSLDSVQILARIDDEFDLRLPPQTLVERHTIEQLADLVASRAVSTASAALVKLRNNGTGQPLFLVHGGKGDITTYGQLAKRIPGRPVYAFQAIGLNGESWPLTSIPAMAGRYLRELIDVDPTGPHLLAGTCMGGLIAFEMAQQLTRSGREVGLLALIDSDFPTRVGRRLRWSERVVEPVRDAMRILRWWMLRGAGLGRDRRWLPAYRKFVHNMNARARRAYRPCRYPGTITLFLASDANCQGVDLRLILRSYARESRVVSIAGRRSDLFRPPAVDDMAHQLTVAMEGLK